MRKIELKCSGQNRKDILVIIFFILSSLMLAYLVFGAPTVTFVEPTPPNMSYVNTSWVYINITSDEDLSQAILEWGDQGGYINYSMSNSSMTNWYINMTSLSDYTYNYTVHAQNTSSDWNRTQFMFVVVDLTAPSLTVTHPADGQHVRGSSITINGTYYDLNNKSVAITINDSRFGSMQGTLSSWYFANTTSLSEGWYSVRVRANDSAGNINDSVVTFFVDNTPPTGGITQITPNRTNQTTGEVFVKYGLVSANFSFVENGELADIDLVLENGTVLAVFDNNSDTGFSFDTSSYAEGTYQLRLNGTDAAGNSNQTMDVMDIIIDKPPSVSVTIYPSNPNTTQDLVCNITAFDTYEKNIEVYWKWYNTTVEYPLRGSPIYTTTEVFSGYTVVENGTNTVLSVVGSGNTSKGEIWDCSVLVGDGLTNATSWKNASVTIGDSPPTTPVPLYPGNNTIINDDTPTFKWNASTDIDNDTIIYGIEISNSSDFSYIVNSSYTGDTNYTSPKLEEGVYYWRMWAETIDANSSVTPTFRFVVDITPPTDMVISAPSFVYIGDKISATCSATDNFDSSPTCTCDSPPTDQVGTVEVICTARDDAGNSAQSTVSVKVESRPSTGGTPAVLPPAQTLVWAELLPGKVEVVKITNEDIGLTEIRIEVKNPAKSVTIRVVKLPGKPADMIHEISGRVYAYIEISRKNLEDENIEKAEITFRVEKSWLESNNLDKDTVVLSRYKENEGWVPLPTEVVSEDRDFVYYRATTPGFSYFAISAQEKEEVTAPTEEEAVPEEEKVPEKPSEEAPPEEEAAPEMPQAPPVKKPSTTTMIAAIVIIIMLGMVFSQRKKFFRKKKKGKKR